MQTACSAKLEKEKGDKADDKDWEACYSDHDLARSLCKIEVDQCVTAVGERMWEFVRARLSSMRVDGCTQQFRDCILSEDHCSEDFSLCFGKDYADFVQMCPAASLTKCRKDGYSLMELVPDGGDNQDFGYCWAKDGDKECAADDVQSRLGKVDLHSMIQGILKLFVSAQVEVCQKLTVEAVDEFCTQSMNGECNFYEKNTVIGTAGVGVVKNGDSSDITGIVDWGLINTSFENFTMTITTKQEGKYLDGVQKTLDSIASDINDKIQRAMALKPTLQKCMVGAAEAIKPINDMLELFAEKMIDDVIDAAKINQYNQIQAYLEAIYSETPAACVPMEIADESDMGAAKNKAISNAAAVNGLAASDSASKNSKTLRNMKETASNVAKVAGMGAAAMGVGAGVAAGVAASATATAAAAAATAAAATTAAASLAAAGVAPVATAALAASATATATAATATATTATAVAAGLGSAMAATGIGAVVVAAAVVAYAVFSYASADCSSDAITNVNYGCASSSCSARVGNGYRIFNGFGRAKRCKTGFWNDTWKTDGSVFAKDEVASETDKSSISSIDWGKQSQGIESNPDMEVLPILVGPGNVNWKWRCKNGYLQLTADKNNVRKCDGGCDGEPIAILVPVQQKNNTVNDVEIQMCIPCKGGALSYFGKCLKRCTQKPEDSTYHLVPTL
jgi:hypothetical protein